MIVIEEIKTVSAMGVKFDANEKFYHELLDMRKMGMSVLKDVQFDAKTGQVTLIFTNVF